MLNTFPKNKAYYKIVYILFFIFILAALIFSACKLNVGINGNDEAFYLTIPLRLTQGDTLLQHEWHVSQLSSFLMAPFVFLYTELFNGTEGIILAARYLYLFMHFAVSVFVFVCLRKHGIFAAIASILYFIFTPYDIMAPSYNTMGLDLVTVTGVSLYCSDYRKPLPLVLCGICFAASVLCNPYLIINYLLFAACTAIHCIFKKRGKENKFLGGEYFSLRTFMYFTLGSAILAAIFIMHIFSAIGISSIMQVIPNILADPEHSDTSILSKLCLYFQCIYSATPASGPAVFFFILILILIASDRKRFQHKGFYFVLTAGDVFSLLLSYIPSLTDYHYNSIMFPVIFLGIVSFILLKDQDYKLLACLLIPGILYSAEMVMSSNQKFYVAASAMASANIASAVFIGKFLTEIIVDAKYDSKGIKVITPYLCIFLTAVLFAFQGGAQIKAKSNHIFGGGKPSEMVYCIPSGPDAGIYAAKNYIESYSPLIEEVRQVYDGKTGNILFLSRKSILYLAAPQLHSASFSAWPSGENDYVLERLKEYYRLNPEKAPDYIYLPLSSDYNADTIAKAAASNGYSCTKTDLSLQFEISSRS